jgi:carboxymethylenebutenolidase
MESSTIEISTRDGVPDAYVTRPDDRRRRGVLFIADAFGLRPTVEEMADRISADGYVVLAPNIFYRAGRAPVVSLEGLSDPDRYANTFQQVRPLMEQLTPERIIADGSAYLDYLADVAAPGPVAITGYCMGGRVGWRIAAAYPDRIAALAAFHTAGLVTDGQDSPHRAASKLKAELYLAFADQDPAMTAEQIATLEQALDTAGVDFRAEVYEGTQHGYTMADTPPYDENARERHFRELRALLQRTLA